MKVKSINPFIEKTHAEIEANTNEESLHIVSELQNQHLKWKTYELSYRIEKVKKLIPFLDNDIYAINISQEMGKPITQAKAEIKKCASLVEYYCKEAPKILASDKVNNTVLEYHPKGVVLGIMPWNFPFWQVFRFAIPALISGNSVALKHSSKVWRCLQLLEQLFADAGLANVFRALYINQEQTEDVIAHKHIAHINFTGSVGGGIAISTIAGKNLKPCVLELGGNNAFVISSKCDLQLAIDKLKEGRLANAGQSCIAPKRTFIPDDLKDTFISGLKEALKGIECGNPADKDTVLGPLAHASFSEELVDQIEALEKKGVIRIGDLPSKKSAKCNPILLIFNKDNQKEIRDIELFAPVFSIIPYAEIEDVHEELNQSKFALGCSFISSSKSEYDHFQKHVYESCVVQNDFVKSFPHLPFGGLKQSGHGSELGHDGMLEFVYRKTIAYSVE